MDFDKLMKKAKRRPMVDLKSETLTAIDYGKAEICNILPNREPFLFLDRLTGLDLDDQFIVGHRHIDVDDPVFEGHFPNLPVYPGVLQLEILSELFCCLYYFVSRNTHQVSSSDPVSLRATRLHDAFFQHGVFPGDDLTIITKVLERTPLTFTGVGQILNGDKVAIAVIGDFYIVE